MFNPITRILFLFGLVGNLQLLDELEALLVIGLVEWHISYIRDKLCTLGQIVLNESFDFGTLERLLAHIDENRARQRFICTIFDCLFARRNRSCAAIDSKNVQLALILLKVGIPKESKASLIAFNTLNHYVVIFANLIIGADRFFLAVNSLGEVIKCSMRAARTVK